jgi:hypothetical protein
MKINNFLINNFLINNFLINLKIIKLIIIQIFSEITFHLPLIFNKILNPPNHFNKTLICLIKHNNKHLNKNNPLQITRILIAPFLLYLPSKINLNLYPIFNNSHLLCLKTLIYLKETPITSFPL